MALEIVMPRMGLTMEEGTVVAWLKAEGEAVAAGELLLEIETDKTTIEIESPGEGILGNITAQPGETLPVGTVIAYLLAEGETISPEPVPEAEPVPAAQPESAAVVPERAVDTRSSAPGKVKASPAARRMAGELGVDLSRIAGTGPGGRVVTWNVETAAATLEESVEISKISPVAQRAALDLGVDLSKVVGSGPGGRITRQDVERAAPSSSALPGEWPVQPVSRSHRIMADRMTASFSQAPHFYLHAEVDVRQLISLRRALLAKFEQDWGLRITVTDILVKLCGLALAQHPALIAQWSDQGLVCPTDINVGIAIDTPKGLLVPVVRQADRLSLRQIAECRVDLVERARAGKLAPKDLEAGVFTLTNLGMFRVDSFDAILNPPQAAILAVGRIKERPIVESGVVVPASLMNLSLSVDHRVVDGATGARFLGDVVDLIEIPGLVLY